ncbi:deoxyribose-phosphate aldolase [Bizionia gelidisalsuginis]|uniref:Deoxyribose-phosphate aldolase n=1 Tax=Bizionia gelidisalsuginis TaxID=291188 RepID=A0ABY3MEG2_9FLAO|nr:deoxyribose-phosphate aldolase [Bizionia gelidisalsuginis]TYC17972.1 deoxyribose-phosphate aldolase [Bizionia gelidisalsuginis]
MNLNTFIDHTLLKPTATKNDIVTLCKEAMEYGFFSVCVNTCYVSLAKQTLAGSSVKLCAVIGFPLGAMSTIAKVEETKQALKEGADEIDMVMNIGFFKSADYAAAAHDIKAVKQQMPKLTLKVILETCYLDTTEIIEASEIALESGADFIKTSTGFGSSGATLNTVQIMLNATKNTHVKVKASGGIRDTATALKYIKIGALRLGTSNSIAIVTENNKDKKANY